MGTRRRRSAAAAMCAVVTLVVLAGACGGGGSGVPGPTVPPGGSSSSTSSPASTVVSYDVPETIDQAYVQHVVSAYDKVLGDAIRVLKRDGDVSDEFLKHLLAIYTEPEFEFQQKAWRELVNGERIETTPEDPGNPVTTVGTIANATATCITFRAERDNSANLTVPQAESEQDDYIVLVRTQPDRDPLALNHTPWVMAFDGFKNDNSVPTSSCDD